MVGRIEAPDPVPGFAPAGVLVGTARAFGMAAEVDGGDAVAAVARAAAAAFAAATGVSTAAVAGLEGGTILGAVTGLLGVGSGTATGGIWLGVGSLDVEVFASRIYLLAGSAGTALARSVGDILSLTGFAWSLSCGLAADMTVLSAWARVGAWGVAAASFVACAMLTLGRGWFCGGWVAEAGRTGLLLSACSLCLLAALLGCCSRGVLETGGIAAGPGSCCAREGLEG